MPGSPDPRCDEGRAGQAPHERQAEQEDRRAERPEQEVLDRALGRVGVGLVVAGQQVARQHHAARDRGTAAAGRPTPAMSIAPLIANSDDDRELGDRQVARHAGSRARTRSSSRRSTMNRTSRNVVSASTLYEPPNAVAVVIPTAIVTTAVIASPISAAPIASGRDPARRDRRAGPPRRSAPPR